MAQSAVCLRKRSFVRDKLVLGDVCRVGRTGHGRVTLLAGFCVFRPDFGQCAAHRGLGCFRLGIEAAVGSSARCYPVQCGWRPSDCRPDPDDGCVADKPTVILPGRIIVGTSPCRLSGQGW